MSASEKTPLFSGHAPSASAQPQSRLGVKILDSPDRPLVGRVYPLLHEIVIGRKGSADVGLVIDDRLLSRRHATIERADNGFALTDHDSTNGTFARGKIFGRVVIEPNTLLRTGETLMYFGECVLTPAAEDLASPLVGTSWSMCELRQQIALVAPSALSILVLGETGTGKEIVARLVHERSLRKGRLIAVNCGAISASLSESAFFGHKRGAFTGATQDEIGYVQAAHGGTLFLDEIGELPLELQATLLRFLDSGELTPVGSPHALTSDVRVIAATHADLPARVATGEFRADLYARLQGYVLRPLPLRERWDDVLTLFDHFWKRAVPASRMQRSSAFSELLLRYAWPLNLRELKTISERLALLEGRITELLPEHLPEEIRKQKRPAPAPKARPDPSVEELREALARLGGNVVQVAAYFGRDRTQIYRWIKKAGLEPEKFR